jgi:hypothetical protein
MIRSLKKLKARVAFFALKEILSHSKENYEKHIAFFEVVLYNIYV